MSSRTIGSDDADTFWITSSAPLDGQENAELPPCHLSWKGWEGYAACQAVTQTALDMLACAAYADVLGELLRAGLDGPTVTHMITGVIRHSGRTGFGHPDVFHPLPAGSSRARVGRVLLERGGKNGQRGTLTADEARHMAVNMLKVANAVEYDQAAAEALNSVLGLGAREREPVFAYMRAMRGPA